MSDPAEQEEMEPNSAEASDNDYDENDSFLASTDEESNYDSLEDSAEETDEDDPDYVDLDPEQLQEDNEKKTNEIIALKALVRSYAHEIKSLEAQVKLLTELKK